MTTEASRGFTLVELVVTIVVLAIALVSVAYIVRLGTSDSSQTLLETRAIALGQAYLDEILARRFDERSGRGGGRPCYGLMGSGRCTTAANFGLDGGEGTNRDSWDDVDDYDGLAEGDGFANPLRDAVGTTRTGYENFSVEVAVVYAGTDAFWNGADLTEAKRLTVRVKYRGQSESWQYSVYKGNY